MNTLELTKAVATKHLTAWTIWKEKRLYIKSCTQTSIHNTRKCRQEVYIDLSTFELHCYTDCPGQSSLWCRNENERVITALKPIARLLRRSCGYRAGMATEPIEVVIHNAILDARDVQGYYTQWISIRVPINRFGKLATRNRQVVCPFSGTQSTAPKGFVPLTSRGYTLLEKRSEIHGEVYGEMLEPYSNPLDYNALADEIDARADLS